MAKRTLTRCLLLLLTAALCLSLTACGQAPAVPTPEPMPTPTPEPLPESDIMFLSIPWGTSEEVAIALVKEMFPDINTVKETVYPEFVSTSVVYESESFADPKGEILPKLSSREIKTKSVELGGIGSVAGYRISSIYLYFIEVDGKYALYKAKYFFADDKEITPLEQFSDLQDKMTKLYGAPKTYSYDEDGYITSTSLCAVWNAGDGSGVYLDYTLYISGSYFLNGSESVWLCYGTTAVNELFESAEREKAEREEEEKQQHIEDVKNDNSGL